MDVLSIAASCVITTCIGAILGVLFERLKSFRKEDTALKDGMKYLLKDRINQSCEIYLEKGYCTVNNLKVIHEMTDIYKKLGGNDFIEELVKKIDGLPSQKS